MQSFRSELENIHNPIVEKDILDLEKKIRLFKDGKIDPEKFRSLRLARGVYGQRQPGVQMVRIKLPFGRITTKQLRRIADIADEYGSGDLHATTRQDIQIHFVSLDKTPELWAKLEQDDITLREACGNTVRNITASATAGIAKGELFDVSPYAYAMFRYFLRNPVGQELGRKVKIAFSSGEDDTAYTFIHDLGFIPKVRVIDGKEERGFKVVIGGGLGANPIPAVTAFEFLEENKIIPYVESFLRVFDRYGERNRRMKARFKFLLQEIGLEQFNALVAEEQKALNHQDYPIDRLALPGPVFHYPSRTALAVPHDQEKYGRWMATNVFQQKQEGYFGVFIKLQLGNLDSHNARSLADITDRYASDEMRITVNQGYLLRFVVPEHLPALFNSLDALGLAEPGFDSVADITACPGTHTCNLGISESYGIAKALEKMIQEEYPDQIHNRFINIKISGCPNSCGQHGLAAIGFHGSTIKDKNGKVLPALVVLLGGGIKGNGEGIISDKIIKIPSKRGLRALKLLLDDYEVHAHEGEYYHDYFQRLGRVHFYTLLKPLGDLSALVPDDYIDWGHGQNFVLHTAVGECAGVIIDLVATLLYESGEKINTARETAGQKQFADAIYHAYSAFINTAKALLLTEDIKPSSQHQVINDFHAQFIATGRLALPFDFKGQVLAINQHLPGEGFATEYISASETFLQAIFGFREKAEAQSGAQAVEA